MNASESVAAVLWGQPEMALQPKPADQAALGPELALKDQSRPPELVVTGSDALGRAIASEAEWLWLLAPAARPDADALERLLEKVEPDGDPAAALVAGMILDPTGQPLEDQLPAPAYADHAAVIRLVEQRTMPVRHAPFANCLIRRSAFAANGLPELREFGPYAATAWTAALLRTEPGYFAPLSIVRVDAPTRATPRDLLSTVEYAIRLNRAGAWTKGEAVRGVTGRVKALRR